MLTLMVLAIGIFSASSYDLKRVRRRETNYICNVGLYLSLQRVPELAGGSGSLAAGELA
jgi:hypothetical protein